MTTQRGTTRSIVNGMAIEFSQGQHQRNIIDLPLEIQFRLGCSWGRALSYANDIRTKRK